MKFFKERFKARSAKGTHLKGDLSLAAAVDFARQMLNIYGLLPILINMRFWSIGKKPPGLWIPLYLALSIALTLHPAISFALPRQVKLSKENIYQFRTLGTEYNLVCWRVRNDYALGTTRPNRVELGSIWKVAPTSILLSTLQQKIDGLVIRTRPNVTRSRQKRAEFKKLLASARRSLAEVRQADKQCRAFKPVPPSEKGQPSPTPLPNTPVYTATPVTPAPAFTPPATPTTPLPIPLNGAGIDARIIQTNYGFDLIWENPETTNYSLTLKNGETHLYYGGHVAGLAVVNYSAFGLSGGETLTGHFTEYQNSSGQYIRTLPWFSISLNGFESTVFATPTPTPNPYRCEELGADGVSTTRQVDVVEHNPACAANFVQLLRTKPQLHLEAFYQLIQSSVASDVLLHAIYDPARFEYFNFNPEILEGMYQAFPAAVDGCGGHPWCGSWRSFILDYFLRGQWHACPDTASASRETLLQNLPFADYDCTELIAAALTPLADSALLEALLAGAESGTKDYGRRNYWRTLIRLNEAELGSSAYTLVTTTYRDQILALALAKLQNETYDLVLHDVIYLIAAKYFPYPDARPLFLSIAQRTAWASDLRFRALAAYGSEIAPLYSFPVSEFPMVLSFLNDEDEWMRAESAYILWQERTKLTAEQQSLALAALEARWAEETNLSAKVYLAYALDAFLGGTRYSDLKTGYETEHIPHQVQGYGITIRSPLPLDTLNDYLASLNYERQAFFDILGAPFSTPISGEPNPTVTLILLGSPAEYEEYMNAFGPCCADAGGVYIEQTGTFYTYDRTPAQSRYTTKQLVQHEFGHYLNGRFVHPGVYGDSIETSVPRLWINEGMAEVLASLEFDGGGGYTLLPHNVHQANVCSYPPIDVASVIDAREYKGSVTYTHSWALSYYLLTRRHANMLAIHAAFRERTYATANFVSLTGAASMAEFEAALQSEIEGWCSQMPTLCVAVAPTGKGDKKNRFATPDEIPPPRTGIAPTREHLRKEKGKESAI